MGAVIWHEPSGKCEKDLLRNLAKQPICDVTNSNTVCVSAKVWTADHRMKNTFKVTWTKLFNVISPFRETSLIVQRMCCVELKVWKTKPKVSTEPRHLASDTHEAFPPGSIR